MFRIAMISRWHPHARENRYVKQLENIPETQITCVWDSDEKRGKEWAEELHADFEADLDTLLQRKDVDGICITAPTDQHREIILKAAKAGKHVFTEKALAMDGREAQEVRKAVKESGAGSCLSQESQSGILLCKKIDRRRKIRNHQLNPGTECRNRKCGF